MGETVSLSDLLKRIELLESNQEAIARYIGSNIPKIIEAFNSYKHGVTTFPTPPWGSPTPV